MTGARQRSPVGVPAWAAGASDGGVRADIRVMPSTAAVAQSVATDTAAAARGVQCRLDETAGEAIDGDSTAVIGSRIAGLLRGCIVTGPDAAAAGADCRID